MTISRARVAAICLAAAIGLGVFAARANEADDRAAIAEVMLATWDRPDAPLDAGPIVVAGDFAVADWTQHEMGGRALVERRNGMWSVVACAGDALRSAEKLSAMGVPPDDADRLAALLADAESGIDPARLARMASFEGTVLMDQPDHSAH